MSAEPRLLSRWLRANWQGVSRPVLALAAAFLAGGLLVWALGSNPFTTYAQLLRGGLDGWPNIAVTLQATTPLVFTGLAVAFAFRGGLWNIGVEGQMLFGALAAGIVGYAVHLPAPLHVIASLAAAAIAGSLWAAIPGLLRAYLNVNELVLSIMLNSIALYLTSFVASRLLKAPGPTNKLPDILPTAQLGQFTMYSQLNAGFFIAIALVIIVLAFNTLTRRGFEFKMLGLSPRFAHYGGLRVRSSMVQVMLISGAIAGLGGAEQTLGVYRAYFDGFSPGYGFDGIAVAMLSNNHPLGVLASAFLFGALNSGSSVLQMTTNVTKDLVKVLQAIVILMLAAQYFGLFRFRLGRPRSAAAAPELTQVSELSQVTPANEGS